jgi:hypothetical protein
MVETVIPEDRLRGAKGAAFCSLSTGGSTGAVVCSSMAVWPNPIKGLARPRQFVSHESVSGSSGLFLYFVKRMEKTDSCLFLRFPSNSSCQTIY